MPDSQSDVYRPALIEDYGMIGDCRTCALVSRDGSIDWLCLPRFDSAACMAALLGTAEHGRWRLGAATDDARVSRAYRDGSVVIDTIIETETGRARVTDFMPVGASETAIIRIVEGLTGEVDMALDLTLRFDYGSTIPWVIGLEDQSGLQAICGPDRITLFSSIPLISEHMVTEARFKVTPGERQSFCLVHNASHLNLPELPDADQLLADTVLFWEDWSKVSTYDGEWTEEVRRSLIVLKALTYAPTGGIVAAATTSLPEQLGGPRNWDYRYCWLRDATLTLGSLLRAGYRTEARDWRDWLMRAAAGMPDQIQIMYGIAGERRLDEWEVPWLPGYENSAPVRVGNAASGQLQLDVFGEVMSVLSAGRRLGLADTPDGWGLQCALTDHICDIWRQNDDSLWEVRSGRQPFTFSKIMCWVALDRSVRDVEAHGFTAPIERWRTERAAVREEILTRGFNKKLNSFTQVFDGDELDASLLLIPHVHFMDAHDPRMIGTVEAIEKGLVVDGLVRRYDTHDSDDGLPPGEGVFLACSFWLVDNLAFQGRLDEATTLFRRLVGLANDLGLIAEEYAPDLKRQMGNFPQAFTHVALVNTAFTIADAHKGQRGARQMGE
ncbi:glycoside hydrolase family 15 protein [Acidisoma cellulosilytica]|uniref:Glycoside hydrolase family 15 protein n=1 Tax=Acidisoma cellulosilyticum TaxID=2802395 RepID=A0A963YZX8_9PROT|nr:glycoside hydrolase family 15 protein [Acidisoma cellulosilyticum]MCB8880243.1 glycoside hydrolase family 15 protein [Acidisoma cellulosilyticum]